MDLKFISKAIEKFISTINRSTDDEAKKISTSINTWQMKRSNAYFVNENSLKKGQIVYTDFGMNYKPEMAYLHPAIILKYKNHMCVVHPCTSNPNKVARAFHPKDNPNGSSDYYLLKANEGGLDKDTAVILNQIQTISVARIAKIYDLNGVGTVIFSEICNRSFKVNYEYQFNQMSSLKKKKSQLEMKISAKNPYYECRKNDVISYQDLVYFENGILCYDEVCTSEIGEKEVVLYLEDEYKQQSEHVKVIINIKNIESL